MLDNLLEIEIAYNSEDGLSPIESHYKKLKAEIAPIDKSTDEYEMIAEYVKNTHAATHSNYTLELQEKEKISATSHSKSCPTVVCLRIAPPEAPVTGYMFGKGIYFADMVSKSANYCCTNTNNPIGLLLLSEVALGQIGVNSVLGVGRTQPDPQQAKVLDDGLMVPLGTPVSNPVQSSLLYNEFIVYDVAQVNVKYLLQTKFNYKK
ncbi:unnamed protein product [Leptidea sinapis]|uniref:Poly [ADP-ribose] polymerase n=1 Tax=Leptidea sinapis TaxID=189913 RepID=A0A5E4PYQ1_9NEOP|nr:unnamed protein product [Leptidea sinapis]